jgi:hypothetical protein
VSMRSSGRTGRTQIDTKRELGQRSIAWQCTTPGTKSVEMSKKWFRKRTTRRYRPTEGGVMGHRVSSEDFVVSSLDCEPQ